jgi:hypothetical protein
MRKRSRSFYAKTKEEFDELSKTDEENSETESHVTRKRSKISLLIEDDDDLGAKDITPVEKIYDDQLGVSNTFTITENNLSMEDEETILLNSLENLNLSFRKRDKEQFLENVSNLFLSSKDRLKTDLTTAHSFQSENKICRSFSLDSLNIMDFDNLTLSHDNPIMMDPTLTQNIKLTDEVLKIILIGDENVGKTMLIEKLINTTVGCDLVHTGSLEIKKKRIKLLERILTLEFWDTNKKILSSKLSESIND